MLQGVQVRFEGTDTYDVEPMAVPDLFAERPLVVYGKYRGIAGGRVLVNGHSAGGAFSQTVDVASSTRTSGSPALGYLWARQRLARLSDFASTSANRAEVTSLGIKYHLMTEYTSFVAADSLARGNGSSTTVRQPSVTPHGVEADKVLATLRAQQPGLLATLRAQPGSHLASIFGQDEKDARRPGWRTGPREVRCRRPRRPGRLGPGRRRHR